MAGKKSVSTRTKQGRDRISVTLTVLYTLTLVLAAVIFIKIIYIQTTFRVDDNLVKYFKALDVKETETPKRGSILDRNGNYLALSVTTYQIRMDCTVRKEEFARKKDRSEGERLEAEWRAKARELSKGLSKIYGDKTPDEYYRLIIDLRETERNKDYPIGKPVDRTTLNSLQKLPLFNEGQYKGGIKITPLDSRQYPYGSLAYRVIGYVKDNTGSDDKSSLIGIEGRYNDRLHGEEGVRWLKVTDSRNRIHNLDRESRPAINGEDVRTTLDIDIQDITDRALRRQVEENDDIEAALAILMDVETGAIRAMVNLQRDSAKGSPLREQYNLAVNQIGEQGSVFKTVALTSLIEDGYVTSLNQEIPSRGGKFGTFRPDPHVVEYEQETGKKTVPVGYGLQISSNYVFSTLVTEAYGKNPQRFYDRIYSYCFGDVFPFDIDGLGKPLIYTPEKPGWGPITLATASYGYSLSVTPLHVATFYNGIANGGRMMRPYLVEDFEKDGRIIEKRKPVILNSICSKKTADMVTEALSLVTTKKGTAPILEKAKWKVAGKTGTAQVSLRPDEHPRKGDSYHDEEGRWKNKGTFAGFFPAENPRYTILVSVNSKLSKKSFYGGTAPAKAILEIVNNLYALNQKQGEELSRTAELPPVDATYVEEDTGGFVPDLKGKGLRDAVYIIENNGFKCTYEGSGHVLSQTPAPNTKAGKGTEIHIVLK